MPKLAVFDLDGTLVDTAPDLAASLNICLEADGLPSLPLEIVRPHAGHGAAAMLTAAYAYHSKHLPDDLVASHLKLFLAHYEANIADNSRPFEGVIAAMDRLDDAGWTLAVCTNKRERLALKLLDALNLTNRFAAVCGQDTFCGMKPDPAHLGGTIERAGSSAEKTVMIGDTMTDVAAAEALAIPSILVAFGYAPDAKAQTQATIVLSGYSELTPNLCDRLLARPETSRLRT